MLLPAVPFGAALAGLLLPPLRARAAAAVLGIAGAAAALLLACGLLVALDQPSEQSRQLVRFGHLAVDFGVRVDSAALLVAVAVGVVALAVQVYSVSYLDGDEGYPAYAAQVSLFTAAMLLVVVAGDLIVLLVGWEVMGICSYLLIAHDRRLPEAPGAAVKAFLVTRVGDVGFWLGVILLGVHTGSFRIADVLAAVTGGELSTATLTAAGLLLLAGVAGKSAQFPLHTWLPDAMAGPTPISALIHAATMVAAGVYVVFRLYPVFSYGDGVLPVLAVVAAVTMLLGALAATAADDIKRVLAWSTVSQLAYMVGALAVGATAAALFHLLTHAAFKALLFLAAGAVIHAVGSNLMSAMGGLRRPMPVTFWSMTIGLGALVGVPPLAGFWSKDAILHSASGGAGWAAGLVFAAGLATVVVTAWYATRLWLRTFFGLSRSEATAHDPPPLMAWPVVALAVPSGLLGFVALSDGFVDRLSTPVPADWTGAAARPDALPAQPVLADQALVHAGGFVLLPLAAAAVGIAAAWLVWQRDPATDPARALGRLRPVFEREFYLDGFQDVLVVRPVRALARAVRRADESVVDGTVEGTGRGTVSLGGLVARAHRAALPRAVVAVLAGALLAGLAATLGAAL
ncbi:MAG: NADH-quinone oxidoreductase subunit L [Micromonosporaceae bacterium]|nr:NADH-quinone oxidoreductase subunit L [Micromonosporaceae bacterium]